jgi:acetyltransferase-like isoleucine patch superfamily enzyme
MTFQKLCWALRGITYKTFFGRFGNVSYIGKPVSIVGAKNIFIGDKVRIYPGIRMETANGGSIKINDDCSIAQNVHITADGEELSIGSGTIILGNSFITNLDHEYKEIGVPILKQKRAVKTTRIGNNCFIGMDACIQAGTILGKQCIVGANAVVRGKFPDYCVIVGVPAKIIKRYNLDKGIWEKV